MTAQSLLVVLREKKNGLDQEASDMKFRENPSYMWMAALYDQSKDLETSIRVIEEVLRSTRETRKELGDPTLEAEGESELHASTPS